MGTSVGRAPLTLEQQMRPFEVAYQELLQSLHDLVAAPELQQQVGAAFAQYAQIAQGGGPSAEMQRLASEAYARYLETLQQTVSSGSTRDRAAEVYRRYVRAVKDAWAALDPDAIDPPVLAAIGQTLTAAGWTAMGLSPHAPLTATPAS